MNSFVLLRRRWVVERTSPTHWRNPPGAGGPAQVATKVPSLRIEIAKLSDDMNSFVLLRRRWVVERTISWFGRNQRLAKDWENLAATLQAFVALASIQIAIRRLAR
jgi:transposase